MLWAIVVDDNDGVREAVRELLEDFGYSVITVRDGKAAIALLEIASTPFDLLVTDLEMQGKNDGIEVVREAKRLSCARKVVLMTAAADCLPMIRSVALAAGADSILWKPFTAEELKAAVTRR